MKLLHYLLAAGAVSLCACTATPSPTAPSAAVKADVLASVAGYDPAFYRAFLQNGFESPDRLEPIRILSSGFRVYLRTEDDAGAAIDTATLDTVERALVESAPIWSGGSFGVTEVVRGTASMQKTPGWLTVKWSRANFGGSCGRSTVGVDGGYIEFNSSGACSCGTPTLVYPRLVRHELGHAMGYYHTGDSQDVMYGQSIPADSCDVQPSGRERRHAAIAHRR
ncbi:MAG TPA: hypothetical protein VNT81_19540 [Vicinamibacterales bacterium]|nr:hypothetical protein [Vicinamibacterales bacterium]